MMATYEQVADAIHSKMARLDVISLTPKQLTDLYGGTNFPRTEARKHIQDQLKSKYLLRVAFPEDGESVTVVFKDTVFAPVKL